MRPIPQLMCETEPSEVYNSGLFAHLLVYVINIGKFQLCLTTLLLPWTLNELFPDCSEYIVRVGWMDDGEHVWVQLLDRQQKTLKVVVIAVESFGCKEDSPFPYVLWEEHSDMWINVRYMIYYLIGSISTAIIIRRLLMFSNSFPQVFLMPLSNFYGAQKLVDICIFT